MHISVPVANTMEYIANTTISPLIGKGYCKVCYVGQDPNRNNTVITKELAAEMGRKLPGSPVVGYFNKDNNDFDGHSRELILKDGKFELVDITKPYGFVPTNANVWFEKFIDDGVEHEYLCCDIYVWNGIYTESQRILDQGNNQSMELTKDSGFWANDDKTNARVFIYNDAIIEKLCILGENVEPCFEGAQVGKRFSLEDDEEFKQLKNRMFSMINELEETLSKGGSQESMEDNQILDPEKTIEDPTQKFEKKPEDEKDPTQKCKEPEDKKPEDNDEFACGSSKGSDEKKKEYNLEEISEYIELKAQYEELQNKYEILQADKASLDSEVATLKEFKLAAERQSKQSMIDSFYMLSDEDKKDVVEHIDTYSLDDIEAKLSILCVRNKVSFSLETKEEDLNPQGLFNLNTAAEIDNAPEWVKALRATSARVQ